MRDLIIQQVYPGTLTWIVESKHPERYVHTAVMNLSAARLTLLYGDGTAILIDLSFFGQSDFRAIEIQADGSIIALGDDKYSTEWFQHVEDDRVQVKK